MNTKYARRTYIQFDIEHKNTNTVFEKLKRYLKPNADALLPNQPAVRVKNENRGCGEPIQERQVILLCFKL